MKNKKKIVRGSLFEDIMDSFFPDEDREEYSEWKYQVAEKIAQIIAEGDNENLYDFFMSDKYDIDPFEKYDNEIYKLFKMKNDVESAAYRILDIIKKEIKI